VLEEQEQGADVLGVTVDVTNNDSVKAALQEIVGSLDIAVNNAGVVGIGSIDEIKKAIIPQGIDQTPEDIAEAVVFIARSPRITGQAIAVDGGITM
jgi:meso-butanediol dehydrogenase/(S,S)-butanediol dehydrogenase/diacetyl reductase